MAKQAEVIHVQPEEDFCATFHGPLEIIPVSRCGVYRVFGDPCVKFTRRRVKVSRSWERQNMVLARNLPGIPRGKLYVHRMAEPYLREALRRCQALCQYRIERIGCFNPRHQRHDSSRPLSYHTWGIAVDINPAQNRPKTLGNMPIEFIHAWETTGWKWGGRWAWRDPMHFQLCG